MSESSDDDALFVSQRPTCTVGNVFYLLPSDKNPEGRLVGVDATSSMGSAGRRKPTTT
jgi:hypothetical protein